MKSHFCGNVFNLMQTLRLRLYSNGFQVQLYVLVFGSSIFFAFYFISFHFYSILLFNFLLQCSDIALIEQPNGFAEGFLLGKYQLRAIAWMLNIENSDRSIILPL